MKEQEAKRGKRYESIPWAEPDKKNQVYFKKIIDLKIRKDYTLVTLPRGKKVKVRSGVTIIADVINIAGDLNL